MNDVHKPKKMKYKHFQSIHIDNLTEDNKKENGEKVTTHKHVEIPFLINLNFFNLTNFQLKTKSFLIIFQLKFTN